jgi:hypothetical protein
MPSRYYHTPVNPVSTRVRCPICHQAVYSRAGIHPQCAARQSESPKPTAVVAVATLPAGVTADRAPAVVDQPGPNNVSTPDHIAD